MTSLSQIAWFYWDPPRIAFTLPFIHHPVVWYGILFVTGFILSYFILNPILTRFLIQTRHLSSLDIKDWPTLIDKLRVPSLSALFQFNSFTHQQLKQKQKPLLTPQLQQGILDGLNHFLQSGSHNRDELQQILNHTINSPKQTAYFLTDRLCWFIIMGTIIGARLGAVFLYDWQYFRQNPIEIFKVWQGGLASHGGVVGVMLALYLYAKYIQQWIPQLTFLNLLDFVAIPSALTACFIRLGNFMNQEIVGTPTNLPWGVVFGHPTEAVAFVPRHPVQLYEAGAYLVTFFILWRLWKNQPPNKKPGTLIGVLFILIFGSRLILEFWKTTQESILNSSFLQMGQILSIPFIILGIFFLTIKNIEFNSKKI